MRTIHLSQPIQHDGRAIRALVVRRLGVGELAAWAGAAPTGEARAFDMFAHFTGEPVEVIARLCASDMRALCAVALEFTDDAVAHLARPAGSAPVNQSRRLN
jgi:hypothetical protein